MFPSFLFHAKPRKLLCLTFGVQFIFKPTVEYYPIDFLSENGAAEEQIFAELKRMNING